MFTLFSILFPGEKSGYSSTQVKWVVFDMNKIHGYVGIGTICHQDWNTMGQNSDLLILKFNSFLSLLTAHAQTLKFGKFPEVGFIMTSSTKHFPVGMNSSSVPKFCLLLTKISL